MANPHLIMAEFTNLLSNSLHILPAKQEQLQQLTTSMNVKKA
jgi:hypothetical protein